MAYTHISAATGAVANRIVTSTNMKTGAYTVANAGAAHGSGFLVTVTHTAVGAADTLGTIIVAGTDLAGQSVTDTITPLSGTTATGTVVFLAVSSVTGAGWVIAEGNDTLTVGIAAGAYVLGGSGVLESVMVNTTAAGAITISDKRGTIAVIKASVLEGEFEYEVAVSGFLKVDLAAASDVTVIHSDPLPKTYAMA